MNELKTRELIKSRERKFTNNYSKQKSTMIFRVWFMIGASSLIVVNAQITSDGTATGSNTTTATGITALYGSETSQSGEGNNQETNSGNGNAATTTKTNRQKTGTNNYQYQKPIEEKAGVINCDAINIQGQYGVEQTERAKFACSLNPEAKMLAAFHQESGWNPNALGSAGEKGVCQLMQNSTNNVRIKDPMRNDWRRQIQKCVEKYLAVPVNNRGLIRSSIGSRAYMKYLYLYPTK